MPDPHSSPVDAGASSRRSTHAKPCQTYRKLKNDRRTQWAPMILLERPWSPSKYTKPIAEATTLTPGTQARLQGVTTAASIPWRRSSPSLTSPRRGAHQGSSIPTMLTVPSYPRTSRIQQHQGNITQGSKYLRPTYRRNAIQPAGAGNIWAPTVSCVHA